MKEQAGITSEPGEVPNERGRNTLLVSERGKEPNAHSEGPPTDPRGETHEEKQPLRQEVPTRSITTGEEEEKNKNKKKKKKTEHVIKENTKSDIKGEKTNKESPKMNRPEDQNGKGANLDEETFVKKAPSDDPLLIPGEGRASKMGTNKAQTSKGEEKSKLAKLTKLMQGRGSKQDEVGRMGNPVRGKNGSLGRGGGQVSGKDGSLESKNRLVERRNGSARTPKGSLGSSGGLKNSPAGCSGGPKNSPAGFSPNSAPRSTSKFVSKSAPKLASKLAPKLVSKVAPKLAPKLAPKSTLNSAPSAKPHTPRSGPASAPTLNRFKCASLKKVPPSTPQKPKGKTNFPSVHPPLRKESSTPRGSEDQRKRNPYETSREKKLTILAKRVRCLTSFESGAESGGGGDAAKLRCSTEGSGGGDAAKMRCSAESSGGGDAAKMRCSTEGSGGGGDASNPPSIPPGEEPNHASPTSIPHGEEPNHASPTSNPSSAANEQRDALLLLLTRDFRANDNWALTYAYELAKKKGLNLIACTYLNRKEKLTSRFINAKLKVLKNLEQALKQMNIPFYILPLFMIDEFKEFIKTHHIKVIACDLHVLNDERAFIKSLCHICNKRKVKVFQVDSHNVIPIWVTSKGEECSVRTIKPKIQALLPTFLTEYVLLSPFEQKIKFPEPFDMEEVASKLTVTNTCAVVSGAVFTEKKAQELLSHFCRQVLDKYNVKRNDPNSDAATVLLPYVNMGVISAQRCILEVHKHAYSNPSINAVSGKESFTDDFIMRKELADNYCYYNRNYCTFEGGRDWAKESLKKHDADKREYLYDYEDFRTAKTHSDLWNCCQLQLIDEGVMHEFLKVYWAKKILNWSANSQVALKYAMQLNEEFSIDGKTPSGYVSIMWSIMGVHDQGWNERNIFGKVRFINSNGCKRNFDMNMFMSKYPKGKENASIVKKIPTITFASYLKKRKHGPAAPLQESTREKRGRGPAR
ncbi:unnamed protein product [Plasmodium vivax]|uniref:Deoxyribodipyrimidine photo-lyase n=2 Tax=Plasmodium vivax TaxID=5855 RepID=A5K9M1_PLAVS|nr:deoxyribodipyrimidine photolyase, putative [Plasmodium vivax]EDL44093.1 deoxyribodipyrimidine photolyase, putative [Plasmodium vivax]CAG9474966.1 unnamed protein product [Plasmodium vivax]CAI7720998.1 deoxyribodipyrimidine photo-lyase, putative [Plasmodium vivax]|eukprot:XP_001613820.1 deoxyribodipyrimidine photolyase [Plasmodium vivax Sal-1]